MSDPKRLISRLFYDELSEAEQRQLCDWLTGDSINADVFMREALVHQHFRDAHRAQLLTQIDHVATLRAMERVAASSRRRLGQLIHRHWPVAAMIALAIAVYLVVDARWGDRRGAPSSNGVTAYIESGLEAVWAAPSSINKQDLPPDSYELKTGLAMIRFSCGAETLVEGPTRFEAVSSNRIRLDRGRPVVRCETAESKGFTIEGPNWDLVDLGTEFGVEQLSRQATTHVFVFDGRVHAASAGTNRQLRAGQGVALTHSGITQSNTAEEARRFVRPDEYRARVNVADNAENQWLAAGYALTHDPVLLLWCDVREKHGVYELTCPTDGGRGASLVDWAAIDRKGTLYGRQRDTTETLQ